LLKTRADQFNEVERITKRLAEIKNDAKALGKTLRLVGYNGELDAIMPRQKRNVSLGRVSYRARSCWDCVTQKARYGP